MKNIFIYIIFILLTMLSSVFMFAILFSSSILGILIGAILLVLYICLLFKLAERMCND